jgi:hypothetical protein
MDIRVLHKSFGLSFCFLQDRKGETVSTFTMLNLVTLFDYHRLSIIYLIAVIS